MFKSEKQLSTIVKHTLRNNPSSLFSELGKHKTLLTEELKLGRGVADLVLSSYGKSIKRTCTLSLHDLSILNVVHKSTSISLHQIVDSTRISILKTRQSLKKLEGENLVILRGDKVVPAKKYVNYLKETYAIEVKLKNWKRALEQAYRYRSFSYHSYVFLDRKHINPALKNKDLFSQYNIGLASVSKQGEIIVHHRSKRTPPFDSRLNMLLNEEVIFHHLSCKKVNQASKW